MSNALPLPALLLCEECGIPATDVVCDACQAEIDDRRVYPDDGDINGCACGSECGK